VSPARRALAVVAAVAVLTACQTGERPSFEDDPNAADSDETDAKTSPAEPGVPRGSGFADPAVRSALFETDAAIAETAVYEILQPYQQVRAGATMTRQGERVAVVVRDTAYRTEGDRTVTCSIAAATCEDGANGQPLSDLQITRGFWGPATQVAMTSPRLDARIGPITNTTETIAGQQATCLEIPGPTYTDRYCALASGTVATIDTAAVQVTLVEYRTEFSDWLWRQADIG
jgi:hypothetical protein